MLDPLETSLKRLEANRDACVHIKRLRFPNYRNLQANSILPFEYPITVLLGRNGCNKSSILHALYGCKLRNSVSDFWFETELDAIPQTVDGLKQSVTHTYMLDEQEVECIKARAPRGKSDPDYWEAVKPTQVYGFSADAERHPPINRPIAHLDFRGELPAFDKYFYFPDPVHLSQRTTYAQAQGVLRREYKKQDYLRQRSRRLRNILSTEGRAISKTEIEILSYILERQYLTGTLLKHNLFHGHEGWTIKFTTESITHGYSDAFAGSGESAAALLVHNILSVPDNSIVLLDEPETSLHPRAQTRLMEFIAHYTARKSLQVVMATHSSHLAERLPQSAIRVMELNSLGRVAISTSHSAREALHEIGDTNANKTVIVEDERAKHIVLSELKCASPRAANDIRVVVRDGGTSRIFRDIQAYANANRSDIFVVFDGDHRPDFDMTSPNDLPSGKSSLVKLIKKITSGPNEKGPDLNFVDSADCIRFLLFYKRFVRFLPGSTPEELVWNDQSAGVLLESFSSDPALLDAVRKLTDHKKRLVKLAECVPGVEASAVFQILVAHFLKDDSPERQQLRTLILEMRES